MYDRYFTEHSRKPPMRNRINHENSPTLYKLSHLILRICDLDHYLIKLMLFCDLQHITTCIYTGLFNIMNQESIKYFFYDKSQRKQNIL